MSATASAIAELDLSDPAVIATREIAAKISTNISIDRPALIGVMTRSYRSTPASGEWSIRDAYNFARRLKMLGGLTRYEYICKTWTSGPDRYVLGPIHPMSGLNNHSPKNIDRPGHPPDRGDGRGKSA
jgi:hypothetical protein